MIHPRGVAAVMAELEEATSFQIYLIQGNWFIAVEKGALKSSVSLDGERFVDPVS